MDRNSTSNMASGVGPYEKRNPIWWPISAARPRGLVSVILYKTFYNKWEQDQTTEMKSKWLKCPWSFCKRQIVSEYNWVASHSGKPQKVDGCSLKQH